MPHVRRAVRFIQSTGCTIPVTKKRGDAKSKKKQTTKSMTAAKKPPAPVARDTQCSACFMLTPKSGAACIQCGEHLPPKE